MNYYRYTYHTLLALVVLLGRGEGVLMARRSPTRSSHTNEGQSVQAVVLAAGQSKRFKAPYKKLVAPLCGRPLISYPLHELFLCHIPTTIVISPRNDDVKEVILAQGFTDVNFAVQMVPRGTGDALACSRSFWQAEHILVLNGDMPLIAESDIAELIKKHLASNATISFLVSEVTRLIGYGRVICNGAAVKIVEERDCTPEELRVGVVNNGIYIMKREFLEAHINRLMPNNQAGELYITDLIGIASNQNYAVQPVMVPFDHMHGVNTLAELAVAEETKRAAIIASWMARGVRFETPITAYVEDGVAIGEGSYIGSGVRLYGDMHVGKHVQIGTGALLNGINIPDNAAVPPYTIVLRK